MVLIFNHLPSIVHAPKRCILVFGPAGAQRPLGLHLEVHPEKVPKKNNATRLLWHEGVYFALRNL